MPAVILAGEEGFWHSVGCKVMPAAAGGRAAPTGRQQARGLQAQPILNMRHVQLLTFVLLGMPFTWSDKQGAASVQHPPTPNPNECRTGSDLTERVIMNLIDR